MSSRFSGLRGAGPARALALTAALLVACSRPDPGPTAEPPAASAAAVASAAASGAAAASAAGSASAVGAGSAGAAAGSAQAGGTPSGTAPGQPEAEAPGEGGAAPAGSALAEEAPRKRRRSKRRVTLQRPEGGPRVELVSAGAEPRRTLRYTLAVGAEERSRLLTSTRLELMVDGKAGPSPVSPDVSILVTLRITEAVPEHRARRELVLGGLELLPTQGMAPSLAARLEAQLGEVTQLTGSDLVDDRGVVHEVQLDTSGIERPELRVLMDTLAQSVGQMGAPLPDEAVGVGASWRVESSMVQQGLRFTQRAVYELRALEGEGGRLGVRIEQSAPPGPMKAAALPAGSTARLITLRATGEGELGFRLDRLMPRGKLESETRMKLAATTGATTQVVEMHTRVAVRFEDGQARRARGVASGVAPSGPAPSSSR